MRSLLLVMRFKKCFNCAMQNLFFMVSHSLNLKGFGDVVLFIGRNNQVMFFDSIEEAIEVYKRDGK